MDPLTLRKQALFEQALMRADGNNELQLRVHQLVTHRMVEFEGIQSGQGEEALYFELVAGNYLSIAIIRENPQLVALLLQAGCNMNVEVTYYIYKDGKKQGPVTSLQVKFAKMVNKAIAQMLDDFTVGLYLDIPIDQASYNKKLAEMKDIFAGQQVLGKKIFTATSTLGKDFNTSIENFTLCAYTHSLYKK